MLNEMLNVGMYNCMYTQMEYLFKYINIQVPKCFPEIKNDKWVKLYQ